MRKSLLTIVLLSAFSLAHGDIIYVCTGYVTPPFIIDEQQRTGLTYLFTDYLNAEAPHPLKFKVRAIERKRLNDTLKHRVECIVPFVSHYWFDLDKDKYSWNNVLLSDGNIIASTPSLKLESLDIDEHQGLTTAQVAGHVNTLLDPLIKQGHIKVIETASLKHSLSLLADNKVDFVMTGKMLLEYSAKSMGVSDKLYFSNRYIQRFDREVLIPKSLSTKARKYLDKRIRTFKESAEWHNTMRTMGITL